MKRPSKRTRRIVLFAAAIVAAMMLATPSILRHVVRSRLQTMIRTQLNAELRMSDLTYTFPYGVEVKDAALVARTPDAPDLELLHVPRFSLTLARSPLRSGPLVIRQIEIDQPSVHLIRTENGLIGRHGLRKTDVEKADNAKPWKVSDMFRLDRLVLHGGQVIYEDHTLPGTHPLVWRQLEIDLDTTPTSGADYAFHFVADNAPVAALDATGHADVDALVLKLESCRLSLKADPAQPGSPLPPEYQRALADIGFRGNLALDVKATLPLSDLTHSTYDTRLEMRDSRAKFPGWRQAVEHLAAVLRVNNGGGRPALDVGSLRAVFAGSTLQFTGGSVVLDPATLNWTATGVAGRIDGAPRLSDAEPQMRGSLQFALDASGPVVPADVSRLKAQVKLTPIDLSVKPAGFSLPLTQWSGASLSLADGRLAVRQLRTACGNDVWFLRDATIDLAGAPQSIRVLDAQGAITFGSPRARYSPELEKILSQLDPGGPWFFKADATVHAGRAAEKADYKVIVSTDRGRLRVGDMGLPVYNVRTALLATPQSLQVLRFDAGVLQGSVNLTGHIDLDVRPRYDLRAEARGIDLNELARAVALPNRKPTPMSGRADLTMHALGVSPAGNARFLDAFNASGELEVSRGDFFRIPVMKSIADSANVRRAITVSEAAAVFDVSHGVVHLRHAAVGAPVLGLDGSGDVDFAGNLKLDVVATVLGDWSKKIDVGDDGLANRIVGQVQQSINVATQTALYDVKVTGSTDKPLARAIPSPYLTDQATRLIAFLNKQSEPGGLLAFVRQPQTAAAHK